MFLLSTDSLRGYGINRIFSFAKDSGFEGLELGLDGRLFDTQNPAYLNQLSKEHALSVRVVKNFVGSSITQTTLACEIAQAIGAQVLVIEPPKIFDFKYKDFLKRQVPVFRKKYGITIALKNGPSEYVWGILPGRSMNSIPDLQNFKEVCLDVSNLYGKKLDLIRAYEMVKAYLVHVELSNVYHDLDHSALDEGIMPLESFLTKLNRDGYEHDISLLVRPKVLRAGDDKGVMKHLEKAMKFYHKYIS